MSETVTFLIVDDHPVLRKGISAVLKAQNKNAEVVESGSVDEAVELAGENAPDVVIVDPKLGDGDPTSTVSTLKQKIEAPVVIFAENGDMRVLSQALKAGARACVRKDSPAETLSAGIEAVRMGEFYIDSALADDPASDVPASGLILTNRQREILQMYADGVHTERVAETLELSAETVRTHTKRILAKLGANTRAHSVAIAVRHQLID
jgi:DNA-binding NarL/FixJ family response regulator